MFSRGHHLSGYVPVAAEKSHARIIWDCAWSAEGDIFATVSRDQLVCWFILSFLSFFLSFLSVAVIYIYLCLRQGKNMETM